MACSPASPVYNLGLPFTNGPHCLCVSYSWVSPLTLGCVYPWVFPIAQFPMVHSPASATTITADLGAPSMGKALQPA